MKVPTGFTGFPSSSSHLIPPAPPPTSPPTSPRSVSVTATGTEPLKYQWEKWHCGENNTQYSASKPQNLQLDGFPDCESRVPWDPSVTGNEKSLFFQVLHPSAGRGEGTFLGDAGLYRVKVSNDAGDVNSTVVHFRVEDAAPTW